MSDGFQVLDSGERMEYGSGLVRDTNAGKVNYVLTRDGPMFKRWAAHLSKGAEKYTARNWMLAGNDPATAHDELRRFEESASRHFEQWLAGETDEDHAAAVFFNLNAAELVKQKMARF